MSEHVSASFVNGVLTVMLDRPEKRNALSRCLITQIAATFAQWRNCRDMAVAVLTGSGEKAFASGGDLKELNTLRTESEALSFATESRAALDAIRHFSVPVVAVLNGDALGGGAELAMACDWRVAYSHTRIGFLQARLNIATAWGGGTDLFRIIGPSRALQVLCTADLMTAADALRQGLVDAVAPNGAAGAIFVERYVATLATRKPQVMRAFKAMAVNHHIGAAIQDRVSSEAALFAKTWVHDDHWAAIDAMAGRMN